tara:strand:+ start:390 stop:1589 length:1200 start_codon:yes stop_codon:yes gene_type:complete
MVLAAVKRGAFFGALSDRLAENREYTRKTSDAMQEYLWTAGLNRRNEVKKSKVQLQEAFDYLTGNGLDEDKALALLDTDPKEMLSLYKVAQNYKLKSGRLSSNILNSAVTMAEGYEAPDMTASELIKKAAPDFIEGAELDPPAQERSFLGKLFGTPSMDEIRYDVYSSEIMGRKGSDIMASISEPTIRARDAAGGVDTDYTGLGAISTTEIRQDQRQIMLDYGDELERKIASLVAAAEDATGDERSNLQNRRLELERISEIDNPKEQLREMMQNPDLGFGIAQQFYNTTPQLFINQPGFIDSDLLPFISGDETYNQPTQETNQERNEDDETTTPPPTTQVPVITIQDYQNPQEQAEEYFRNNPDSESLVVTLPDGSEKRFRKIESGTGRNKRISVQEVG